MVRSLSVHVYMLGSMFYHVFVLNFYMFACMFLCLYVQIYVFTCLCAWIYVLYMLYASFSWVCVLYATFVCLDLDFVIVALLSLYLSFLRFGLLVWTRSRSYGLCHCPYTLAHIKWFGSPILHVYDCLLLYFMLVLASLVLGFAMLDAFSGHVVVW